MNLDLATLAHEGLRGIITNAKQQHRLHGLVISTLAELYERHHTCCAKLAALCCTLWSWCVYSHIPALLTNFRPTGSAYELPVS